MSRPVTVTQFLESIKALFRETFTPVVVEGEITELKKSPRYVTFDLKDDSSRMRCFLWSTERGTTLANGMAVRVIGTPTVYVPYGSLSFTVTDVELVGEGALKKAFEALQKKLEQQGLFRIERKRAVPAFPEAIGVITSSGAAAYKDTVPKLQARWPFARIKFIDVKVQGIGAPVQIVRALDTFSDRQDVDVVLLVRGGGNYEDLQAFNDERVAQAIYRCSVPVIVGVGHERDVTIADFVADVRAATPTNAAERAVPDRIEVFRRIEASAMSMTRMLAGFLAQQGASVQDAAARLQSSFTRRTEDIRLLIARLPQSLRAFVQYLAHHGTRTEHLARMLSVRIVQRLDAHTTMVSERSALLQSLSPLAILKRGYSITTDAHGKTIHRSAEVSRGDHISTRFSQGTTSSDITEVT
jgi:exodeoxyribonuclease VII large subunit